MAETDDAKPAAKGEETLVGTAGWVGVVIACSLVALLILTWLGPLGDR